MQENQQHIKEIEVSVLSSAINSSKACEFVLTMLKEQDFAIKANRLIFQAIVELYKNNIAIDITTVSEYLVKKDLLTEVDGIEYLSYIVDKYISDSNVKEHVSILVEWSTKRDLDKALLKIQQNLDSDKNVKDILSDAEFQIIQVSNKRNSEELAPISEDIDEVVQKIEQLQKSNQVLTGISSGIGNLDNLTSGFQAGDLIILAARPSMGKTALALNFALNAADTLDEQKDEVVVIFSLEMPKDQLITRMISSEGNFDANKLRTRTKFSQDDWLRISTTAQKLKQKNIIIDDSPGLRILDLQTKLRKLSRDYKIKLVVIDYLQLLSNSGISESRQQEVSNISRSLKVSARELNVPIICLSQLSRLVERREEKRPLMSDLRESGAIEQDADLIMFLYRDDYYKEKNITEDKAPEQENHLAEIIISKHRNGPTGKVFSVFIPKWGKFENYQSS